MARKIQKHQEEVSFEKERNKTGELEGEGLEFDQKELPSGSSRLNTQTESLDDEETSISAIPSDLQK